MHALEVTTLKKELKKYNNSSSGSPPLKRERSYCMYCVVVYCVVVYCVVV